MYYALILVIVAAIAADLYDITLSVKGIKLGVGVEGTSYICFLAGTNKPTFFQYLWINMLIPIAPLSIAGLIYGYGNPIGAMFFTITLAPMVWSHIAGARSWKYLINGGNPNLYEPKWWQKLLSTGGVAK